MRYRAHPGSCRGRYHTDRQRGIAPGNTITWAAQPSPQPRPVIERPAEVHLHLHGVSPADIAAMLARRHDP